MEVMVIQCWKCWECSSQYYSQCAGVGGWRYRGVIGPKKFWVAQKNRTVCIGATALLLARPYCVLPFPALGIMPWLRLSCLGPLSPCTPHSTTWHTQAHKVEEAFLHMFCPVVSPFKLSHPKPWPEIMAAAVHMPAHI